MIREDNDEREEQEERPKRPPRNRKSRRKRFKRRRRRRNPQFLPVLIAVALIVLIGGILVGKILYDKKAAKLSGINTNRTLFFAYTNMGFLSAVAALVCIARFNSAAPSAGTNYELDAIGACYIGGASAYGGTGTIGGAVIGAIFMGVLNNGMSILGIDSNWQRAVKGLVLLAAVVFDVLSKKRSTKA